MVISELRSACARVATQAQHVRINLDAIGPYAASLTPLSAASATGGIQSTGVATAERETAFWFTLDAINFGSGWFPTMRKGAEPTGYRTIAAGIRRKFAHSGQWSPQELRQITARELATWLEQDPEHELMQLFERSLRDLGAHVGGSYLDVLRDADHSAVRLVEILATWDCFADTSLYDGRQLPFLKRAQITAADLHRGGVTSFDDIGRLTMFADNLVPHVLRLDGVLWFEPELTARIAREELIEHGSPEEIEIRACAVHAVELLVAASPRPTTAAAVDEFLWSRGQQAAYKAVPRHRSRSTAY